MRGSGSRLGLVLAVLATTPSALAVAAPLMIESTTTCPSGPAIAAALAVLSPPSEWPSGTVFVKPSPDGILVELVADEPTRRELRVPADCGVRATTVALVIAAWTGALESDAAGSPVLRRAPPTEPAPTPPPGPPTQAPPGPGRTTTHELCAGLLASFAAGWAPGLRIGLLETRAPRGFGWQVDFVLPAQRERGADGVNARWTRAALSLAVNARTTVRRLALSLDAGLTGAYALSAGRGYRVAHGSEAFTGGVVGGARMAVPWGPIRVFTDLRGYRWLFPQTVAVASSTGERVAEVVLPSLDVQWTVGLAYPFR